MKVTRQISTGKIVYRQDPEFDDGKGVLNSLVLFPEIPESDLEEVVVDISEKEFQKLLRKS